MAAEAESADFEPTPKGWALRWKLELEAARKALEKSRQDGETALRWYLDTKDTGRQGDSHWNLFAVGIQVQKGILYGQTPKTMVGRRFADQDDDEARVAAVIHERHLNSDIEMESDTYAQALDSCLDDMLVPGIAVARCRYVADWMTQAVPPIHRMGPDGQPELGPDGQPIVEAEGYETQVKSREGVEVDYVHWKDFLYSPCRVWTEARWGSFKALLSKEAFAEKFGKALADVAPTKGRREKDDAAEKTPDPWARIELQEIWDKEHKKVFFYVEGMDEVLRPIDPKVRVNEDGSIEDPLKLDGFFPFPEPIICNTTNSDCIPRPDFAFAQDLYKDLDLVSARISQLISAIKAAGVYNPEMGELATLVSAGPNKMYPATNWQSFSEKGGVANNIEWLPIQHLVAALDKLRDVRQELIDGIYQVTGLADIMRGQASEGGVTATEQSIKAKFGSVRMRQKQMRFAKFASDTLRIKGEIIAKHFDAKTILDRSNILRTADAQFAEAAVALLKSDFASFRIEVKPEAISLADSAAMKQQRGEAIQALAAYFSSVMPIGQQSPTSIPFLLRIAQWSLAPLEGFSTIEGEFDRMVAAAERAAQAPPPQAQAQPDPSAMVKLQAQAMKGQQDLAKVKAELDADMVRAQIDVQTHAEQEKNQAYWNNWERQRQDAMQTARESQRTVPKPPPHPGGTP